MQVRTPSLQHEVMIEAVENHMPQVIVIDEIGTELEAQAARTIAERGVQLIEHAAHRLLLRQLVPDPLDEPLVDGVVLAAVGAPLRGSLLRRAGRPRPGDPALLADP